MARRPLIRAGRRTQTVVSWTIAVVVVGTVWLLGSLLLRHLGVP
jgi:hypothetical protein